jgi:hypothetical protein
LTNVSGIAAFARYCWKRTPTRRSQTAAENDELASQRISKDFVAMGWDHPLDAARLWRSLVVEAALLELRSSRRRPALRAVLGRFLDQSVV